jgi:hypothetical protein
MLQSIFHLALLISCCTACTPFDDDLAPPAAALKSAAVPGDCTLQNAYALSLTYNTTGSFAGLWTGYGRECLGGPYAQTSWSPSTGILQIRSTWQILSATWTAATPCAVPKYSVNIQPEYNYWVTTVKFLPSKCLIEENPDLTFRFRYCYCPG